ncbi:MAG: hypothetical protein AB7W28_04080 [Armatimonadota bacterium]
MPRGNRLPVATGETKACIPVAEWASAGPLWVWDEPSLWVKGGGLDK